MVSGFQETLKVSVSCIVTHYYTKIWEFVAMYLLNPIFLSVAELRKIYACRGPHEIIIYPNSGNRKLASILKIDTSSIFSFAVFLGHGYLQRVGSEFCRHDNLGFHVYLFSADMPDHDLIIYGYNWNLQISGPGEGNSAEETELATLLEEAVWNVPIIEKKNYSKSKKYVR